MKKILIDTSILIDFLRRKNKEKSLLVKLLDQEYSPSISLITYAELFAGKSVWEKREAHAELEKLLSGLEIIILSRKVCRLAGKIRQEYHINLLDAMIAGEAIVSHLPLVTLNLKDFEKIKEVELLKTKF